MSESIPLPSPSGPGNPKDGDQYREYYIPARSVEEERKLLEEYETDRFTHALREIHSEFYLLIELMRGYAENNDDEDFTYFLLAEKLQHFLGRLSKACSATVDWKLITRKTVGVES